MESYREANGKQIRQRVFKRQNLLNIMSYFLVKRIVAFLISSQICRIMELDYISDLCTVKNVETLFRIDFVQLGSNVAR